MDADTHQTNDMPILGDVLRPLWQRVLLMKKMVENVFLQVGLIMSVLMLPIFANATEAQCRSVLQDCDKAVKALQTENGLQAQIIRDQDERFKLQSSELNTAQIWKPLFLGAGIVIGVETLVLILKH